MIRHIVLWKLRAEDAATRAEQAETVSAKLMALKGVVPEILDITVAPNGHLIVCEDQYTETVDNHLRGITRAGPALRKGLCCRARLGGTACAQAQPLEQGNIQRFGPAMRGRNSPAHTVCKILDGRVRVG